MGMEVRNAYAMIKTKKNLFKKIVAVSPHFWVSVFMPHSFFYIDLVDSVETMMEKNSNANSPVMIVFISTAVNAINKHQNFEISDNLRTVKMTINIRYYIAIIQKA